MLKRIFTFLVIGCLVFGLSFVFAEMLASKKTAVRAQREEKIKARVKKMAVKLTLSEEQKTKITEILTQVKEETSKLLEETGIKMADMKAKGEKEIEEILSVDQKDKYYGFQDEEDEEYLKVFKSSY